MPTLKTDPHRWIEKLCGRFADATGWPLTFVPVGTVSELPAADGADELCWSADVADGEDSVGRLQISLSERPENDRSFLAVCEVAEVMASLAEQVCSAERNLELRTQQFATLVDIGLSVPKEEDLIAALDRLLKAALQLSGFRSAGFFLLNPKTDELKLRVLQQLSPHDIPNPTRRLIGDSPDMTAFVTGSVVVNRDEHRDVSGWLPEGCATAICVAVQSKAGPIGTLWAFDRRSRRLEPRETQILESIAAQIAAVLERVVLLRESAEQHRQQRDLDIASQCQPHDILSALGPDIGIDVAAVCTSRFELGGDLCELIPLDEHRTLVAIGDASGDGVPAAIVMSSVRGALRALAETSVATSTQTESLVLTLNNSLHSITPAHQFMSLICGILDTREMAFTYTNAGHPMPLIIRNGQMMMLDSHGMLLGVLRDATYQQSTFRFQPGDVMIGFSDGISEAMNAQREMYRSEGVYAAVFDRLQMPAHDIVQTVWSSVETHSAGSHGDDRTLLVIKLPV